MKNRSHKEEEFINMVQTHSGTINSLCKVFSASTHDFKDARQDIMIQLWRSYESFKGEASLNTWIYRLSLNTLLKRNRDRPKHDMVDIEDSQTIEVKSNRPYSDDDVQLLYNILGVLKPKDKAIMILYIEGYKYFEIGDILNVSATNVSSKINRIKNRLSQLYKTMQ